MLVETEATKRFLKPPRLRSRDYLVLGTTEYRDKLYFIAENKTGEPLQAVPRDYRLDGDSEGVNNLYWPPKADAKTCVTAGGTHVAINAGGWPSNMASAFIQNIPENWRDEHDSYNYQRRRIAITDYSVTKLSVWPKDRLVFEDQETAMLFAGFCIGMEKQNERATLQADFKLYGAMPISVGKMENLETEKYPLSDYQKTAVALCLNQPSYALFMEQGTGKTATAIARVNIEAQQIYGAFGKPMKVLVVCPNQVRLNWLYEFQKFATVPGYVARVNGSQINRVKTILDANNGKKLEGKAFTCCVTSYDSFANDIDYYKLPAWDLVIYDESHYFKNSSTKRFKAIRKFRDEMEAHPLRDIMRPCRVLALTGTPITNHALDLYAQLEALGEGSSGFYTWKGFKNFHAHYIDVGQTATGGAFKKLARLANVPLLQERLSRFSFRITKKEAGLQLPDKTYDVHEVKMTGKQSKIYDKVANDLFAQIEDEMTGEVNEMEASNILTRLLRLAQITSGHVKYDDADSPAQIDPHNNPKVDALMELLLDENKPEAEKTIVWAIFVEDIQAIERALTLHNDNPARKGRKLGFVSYYGQTSQKNREKAIEAFNNDPECKIFVANPAAAGAGLNLLGYNPENPQSIGQINVSVSEYGVNEVDHTYTGHEVFFSQNWSMVLRAQAEDRAHRRGTKMPVRITDLVVPDTIDVEIRDRVQGKIKNANNLQNIRGILKALKSAQRGDE